MINGHYKFRIRCGAGHIYVTFGPSFVIYLLQCQCDNHALHTGRRSTLFNQTRNMPVLELVVPQGSKFKNQKKMFSEEKKTK